MSPYVWQLTQADQGRTVCTDDGRTGWLFYGPSTAYRRFPVLHWWLSIPNERFGRVHLSLQWSENRWVEFAAERPDCVEVAA